MNDNEIIKNGFGLLFFFEELGVIVIDLFLIIILSIYNSEVGTKTLFTIAGYIFFIGTVIAFIKSFVRWKKVKKDHKQILTCVEEQDKN